MLAVENSTLNWRNLIGSVLTTNRSTRKEGFFNVAPTELNYIVNRANSLDLNFPIDFTVMR